MMIKELIKIANELDFVGLAKEADYLDMIIKKTADDWSRNVEVSFIDGFEEKHLNPNSNFSHFIGSKEELKELILNNIYREKEAWVPGRQMIPLPPEGFYSGVVTLEEGDKLYGEFVPHMGYREPRKSVRAKGGEKQPAEFVKALIGKDERGGKKLISVFSLNASMVEDEPINLQTMMYNRFMSGIDDSSPEEFVEQLEISFNYWKDKAMFMS